MRHTTHTLVLLGFCGCLLHIAGCGGSSEPTSVASNDPPTANPAPAPAPSESEPTTEESGNGDEGSSGYGGESGGYEDPSGYGSESGGYADPSGYGGGSEGPSGYGYGESSYGEGEMGYGYGEPGYGGGRSGGNSWWEKATSGFTGLVTPAVSQLGGAGRGAQGPPKSYLDRAAEAYDAGNEALARDLYLTHLVGEFEDADQAFSETQFSSILKRPTWAMQWGVSVHVRFSGDGEQKIHPVRDNMPSPMGAAGARRGMRGGNRGGGYEDAGGGYGEGSGYGAPGSGGEQEYGYGQGAEGAMQPGGPGMRRNGGAPDRPVASTVDLREQLGLVADVTSEMFGSRLKSGAYGSAFAAYAEQSKALAGARERASSDAMPRQAGADYAEMSSATGEYGPPASGGGDNYGMAPQGGQYGMAPQGSGYGESPGYGEGSGYGEAPGDGTYEAQQEGGQYGTPPEEGGYGMPPQNAGYGAPSQEGEYGAQGAGYGMPPQNGGYGMQGGGGYGMQPGQAMGPGNRPGGSAGFPRRSNVPAPALSRWRPGIVFVGKMNSAEALAKAQEHSLDFLIHFDVAVRTTQAGSAKNTTRIRVYPVGSSKPLVTSKPIDNFEIYKLAQADRKTERECVEEVVSSLFEILDEKMVMRPMPTLKPESAQNRVITLVESAGHDLLRSLAEIRLYQWQQAIDIDDVATAFHMAAGDDGLTILHGLPAAKKEILEGYLDASP